MAKSLMDLTMGKEKKVKKKSSAPTTYPASRVLPLRVALIGHEYIIQLPLITRLPKDTPLAQVLESRKKLIKDYHEEKHSLNSLI